MKIKNTLILMAMTTAITTLQGCALSGSKNSQSHKAAEYQAQLGIGYLQRNRLNLAKQYLDKALKSNRKSPAAHHYSALLQERLGNSRLAGGHFAQALKRDGKNPELLNNYGSFLCKQGAVERAETIFLRAAADPLYRTPEFAFANAGICLKKRGEQQRSATYLHKALTLKPHFPSALFHMADLSYQRGENAKAQAYLYRYNERAPATPGTLALCYRISMELNETASANQCSGRLLANFPNSKEASAFN